MPCISWLREAVMIIQNGPELVNPANFLTNLIFHQKNIDSFLSINHHQSDLKTISSNQPSLKKNYKQEKHKRRILSSNTAAAKRL